MPTLFIATGNSHKLAEIRAVLGSGFDYASPRETGLRLEPEETGLTFADNARIKAVAWAGALGADPNFRALTWVLADDSGLEVDALDGAPGVHSARYAALDDGRQGNSPDAENNAKLLRCLGVDPETNRTARFCCVLALTPIREGASDRDLELATNLFQGTCEGQIQPWNELGTGGFGYDPLFVPQGYHKSLAELGADVKNAISHRARALGRLAKYLQCESGIDPGGRLAG